MDNSAYAQATAYKSKTNANVAARRVRAMSHSSPHFMKLAVKAARGKVEYATNDRQLASDKASDQARDLTQDRRDTVSDPSLWAHDETFDLSVRAVWLAKNGPMELMLMSAAVGSVPTGLLSMRSSSRHYFFTQAVSRP